MKLIIKFEIILFIHKTLSQYAPGPYYRHPEPYTRAAYFELYSDQEYKWPKDNIKAYRRRKKYQQYYVSAEVGHRSKTLKCKCKKRRDSYDETRKDGCSSSCEEDVEEKDLIVNYEPYKVIPVQFPTNYYPLLPCLRCDQDSDQESREKHKKEKNSKEKNDKDKKEKSSSEKKDKVDKGENGGDKEDTDSSKKKDEDGDGKNQNDKTSAEKNSDNTGHTDGEVNKVDSDNEKVHGDGKDDATKVSDKETVDDGTGNVEHSTVPYKGIDGEKLFLKHTVKKKQCLQKKSYKNASGSRVGRYFYNDLIMRPTIESGLYKKSRY